MMCFATTRISRDGAPVGYMLRGSPPEVGSNSVAGDPQWQFFAGDEDQAFVDDPDNINIFSVNTIANHDPAILPYLDAPHGTAWIRDGDGFRPDV